MPAKILVVDDEPDWESLLRQKFRKKIRQKEFLFIFARNGLEALEKLQAEPDIDMVLTDINMPEMDGMTLLTTLSGLQHPTLQTVIISAYGDMEKIRKAMNLGAFDFLTKPIDLEDLEITINKTLNYVRQMKQALKQQHLVEQALALRESEKRLTQFIEAVPVGVLVVDAKGKPLFVNQTAQKILGSSILPEANIDRLSEVYQIYLAGTQELYPQEKLPVARAFKGEIVTVSDLEIHQGNKIIPLEVSASPIFNERREIIYAIAAFKDITERKKAEAERIQFTQQLEFKNVELSKINLAYSHFVPKEFLRFLGHQSILDIRLGESVQKKMSILFSDIRSFTSISESMTLADNFRFINAYLSRMEPAIQANHGFIDKYIGDAIMALFGRCADDALKAAIAMQKELNQYNTTRQRPKRRPISIGIGINTGSLMLGTVGGANRMDTTVISDAVNLAARLEDLTKVYGASILISGQTFLELKNYEEYNYRFIGKVKVKGKQDVVSVFEIFDADRPEIIKLKRQTKTKFEEGVVCYFSRQNDKAYQIFQELIKLNPGDYSAVFYLKKCEETHLEIIREKIKKFLG